MSNKLKCDIGIISVLISKYQLYQLKKVLILSKKGFFNLIPN